uniref:Uncharacterized protein n=1 Tax=Panagrolaimus sp. ES5 TaxID=591445 RepID=A0AC34FF66_9BILA
MKKNINFNSNLASSSNGLAKNGNNLTTKWIIGTINKWNFLTFQEYLKADSEEEIFQLFLKGGDLNVHRCEKVTVFMPDSIPAEVKFRQNLDNRFVYCAAEMNIDDAEKIQQHFVLSLLLSIFPKFQNITAAFYNYDGRFLELGIYFTGIPCVDVPVDRSIYRWPEDIALPVGHKLKQMILSQCPSCRHVDISVTNAIPSDTSKCTDPMYEYKKSKRIFLKC